MLLLCFHLRDLDEAIIWKRVPTTDGWKKLGNVPKMSCTQWESVLQVTLYDKIKTPIVSWKFHLRIESLLAIAQKFHLRIESLLAIAQKFHLRIESLLAIAQKFPLRCAIWSQKKVWFISKKVSFELMCFEKENALHTSYTNFWRR